MSQIAETNIHGTPMLPSIFRDEGRWKKRDLSDEVLAYLARGGDVNAMTKKGMTLAHFACYYGDDSVLRILSQHSVDYSLRTTEVYNWTSDNFLRKGSTPLDAARLLIKGMNGSTLDAKECVSICMYTGEWKQSKRHGRGRQVYEDGSYYDGDWKEDKREGEGIYSDRTGEQIYLSGSWRKGKFFGEGKRLFRDGSFYEGQWENDKKCGRGRQVLPTGVVYDGDWKENVFDGRGSYIDESGNKYEGEWKGGKREGEGVQIYTDKTEYHGEWRENLYHGTGVLIDGEREDMYTGSFVDGKRHGKGKQSYKYEGGVYEGVWIKGERHGCGIMTWPNGQQTLREYVKGKLMIGRSSSIYIFLSLCLSL